MAGATSYVIEATPFDPVAGAARFIRASSGGASRRFRQSGNWQLYRGALLALPSTVSRIAIDGTLIGSRSLPELGEISLSLANVPNRLDWYRLQWVGRSITIKRGTGSDIDSFETVQVADVVAAPFTDDTLTLQLAGGNAWLDANVASRSYLGTGGLSGNASLKGLPILQIYGLVENATPDLLDDGLQLYQLHDRQMSQILWVRDRGQLISFHSDYANGVQLLAAVQAGGIPKGYYGSCLAEGLMALGAKPTGRITFAARGDNQDGYAETAADIATLLMARAGVPAPLIDQASLDAAEAAFAANSGLVLRQPLLLRDVLDRLALSAECITTVSAAGRIGWTRLVVTPPIRTLRGPRLQSVQGLVTPPPPKLLKLGYRPNWTPMSQDELATLIANDPGVPSGPTPPSGPYEGQLWRDTSATVIVLRRWSGSAWDEVSRLITGTSQLIDDADLGQTANWAGVSGTGKPQDNATRNVLRGEYAANTLYSKGDTVRVGSTGGSPGLLYEYINASPSQNIAPPDVAYWQFYVRDGVNGGRTDYKFRRSAAAPTTPTGDNPAGWLDAAPAGNDALWMSFVVRDSAGVPQSAWSTPQRISGTMVPPFISETVPPSPADNPLWYKPSTDELFSWGGGSIWVRVGGSGDLAFLNAVDTSNIVSGAVVREVVALEENVIYFGLPRSMGGAANEATVIVTSMTPPASPAEGMVWALPDAAGSTYAYGYVYRGGGWRPTQKLLFDSGLNFSNSLWVDVYPRQTDVTQGGRLMSYRLGSELYNVFPYIEIARLTYTPTVAGYAVLSGSIKMRCIGNYYDANMTVPNLSYVPDINNPARWPGTIGSISQDFDVRLFLFKENSPGSYTYLSDSVGQYKGPNITADIPGANLSSQDILPYWDFSVADVMALQAGVPVTILMLMISGSGHTFSSFAHQYQRKFLRLSHVKNG
jgi:hypothetical protein